MTRTSTSKVTETHRDFTLTVQRYACSGHWDGMARGLGTVMFNSYGPWDTADAALANLRDRLDVQYARGLGVFAGRAGS